MRYEENDLITFRKNHACGNNVWEVYKTGAIIKLKCTKCNRVISLLATEIDKRIKK